jgi:hypothetical protein
MAEAEVDRYLNTHRGRIELQLWMFSYNLRHRWPEQFWWWIAFHLPRKVALFAMVRVAAASGKGPDELTFDSMYKHWERGERK